MTKVTYTLKGSTAVETKFFENKQVAEGFIETLKGRGKLISTEQVNEDEVKD